MDIPVQSRYVHFTINMIYTSLTQLEKKLKIQKNLYAVENKYPLLISDYYLKLINKENGPDDPIWKQCMPDPKELEDTSSSFDPLAEEKQMPVAKLIHRYTDRAVLLTTSRCSTQCRFCFRKRYWKSGTDREDITDNELDNITDYLKTHREVKEILLSGGDPLILSNKRIKYILDSIYSVKSVEIVRIASRVPVTLPSRVENDLVNLLSSYEGIWFVTHFNHPCEVTPTSLKACKKIISSGIPILNQTVLLKEINDKPEILETLFRKLVKNHIKPHYLFHVDPVKGVKHYATGIHKGLEILDFFRRNVSSIATPHFAIDLPEGGGKVSLQPDYSVGNKFQDTNKTKLINYYSE
ncbi:MAG TPA: KamA family radical SAM protein [Victivallales bacterium]|nr:KamA family radical SAM protein [Victivallales bacterium]